MVEENSIVERIDLLVKTADELLTIAQMLAEFEDIKRPKSILDSILEKLNEKTVPDYQWTLDTNMWPSQPVAVPCNITIPASDITWGTTTDSTPGLPWQTNDFTYTTGVGGTTGQGSS